MSKVATLVLAAGSGERFGEPKQFLELRPGVRLVDAAVETSASSSDEVVVVLPPGYGWDGAAVDAVVTGGSSRIRSVAQGLLALSGDEDVILIHDAAHPLAPEHAFLHGIEAIRAGADAAVPILEVSDVVKKADRAGRLTTVGRDGLGLSQVPMAFSARALRAAHEIVAAEQPTPWEDSMLVEEMGGTVVAVAGSSRNIHVVTLEDLRLVRVLAAAGA